MRRISVVFLFGANKSASPCGCGCSGTSKMLQPTETARIERRGSAGASPALICSSAHDVKLGPGHLRCLGRELTYGKMSYMICEITYEGNYKEVVLLSLPLNSELN